VVMVEVGLNDPKTRKQLDPELRQGYLDLLQSTDIQLIDRGTSKSVRVILEMPPKLLAAPAPTPQAEADPPAAKSQHKKQTPPH